MINLMQSAHTSRGQEGATLVEVLLHTALLTLVLISLVAYGLGVAAAASRGKAVEGVQSNSRYAFSVLGEKIRNCDAVLLPSYGASSNQLLLDMPGTSSATAFTLRDGRLVMNDGARIPI
jgi:hypothetical protein